MRNESPLFVTTSPVPAIVKKYPEGMVLFRILDVLLAYTVFMGHINL